MCVCGGHLLSHPFLDLVNVVDAAVYGLTADASLSVQETYILYWTFFIMPAVLRLLTLLHAIVYGMTTGYPMPASLDKKHLLSLTIFFSRARYFDLVNVAPYSRVWSSW